MKKKRILPVFLALVLTFNMTVFDYQEAHATGGVLLPVLQGGAAAAGVTVGGALAATLAVVAVAYGAYVVVDNWEEISSACGDFLNNTTGAVKDWWDNLTGSAVKNDEPTVPLPTQPGEVIDFFDYYIPSGGGGSDPDPDPENDPNKIKIDKQVGISLASFLAGYYGYESLTPGSVNTHDAEIQRIFDSHGVSMTDSSFKNYQNVVIYDTGTFFNVVASNSSFFVRVDAGTLNRYYPRLMTDETSYIYDYSVGNFVGIYSFDNLWNVSVAVGSQVSGGLLDESMCNLLLYTNNPLHVVGTVGSRTFDFYLPSMAKEYDIPESNYKWTEPGTEWQDQEINMNDYLIDGLADVDLNTVTNTDQLIEKIKNADTVARQNGDSVLGKQIVNSADPVPTPDPGTDPGTNPGTDPVDLTATNNLIQNLPNAISQSINLSSTLNDLFVPSGGGSGIGGIGNFLSNFFNFDILYQYHEMIETFLQQRVNNNSPPVFKIYLKQSGLSYYRNMPDSVTVIDFGFMENEIFTWGITIRYFVRSLLTFFVLSVWLNKTIKKLPGVVGGLGG